MKNVEGKSPSGEAPEGVIKFQLEFRPAPAPAWDSLADLNAWRKILYLTGLIGQQPHRYEGYAYGNVSVRLPGSNQTDESVFIICGTQTGAMPELSAEHYTTVSSCNVSENKVVAHGPVRPSSEAMSHSMIYQQDADTGCVLHAHSPDIWKHAVKLGLPVTAADIPYGTPQMADAVKTLFQHGNLAQQRIFSMAGHQDGIISFGVDPCEAGTVMLKTLARSLAV